MSGHIVAYVGAGLIESAADKLVKERRAQAKEEHRKEFIERRQRSGQTFIGWLLGRIPARPTEIEIEDDWDGCYQWAYVDGAEGMQHAEKLRHAAKVLSTNNSGALIAVTLNDLWCLRGYL